MPAFVLELGTEEIPARMIDSASAELARRIGDLLSRERLASASPQSFSTPRRLAVLVTGIAARQADVTENVTGPPVKAAFKDGVPTAAAHAFAKKAGVALEKLQRVSTPKGEYLAAEITTPGRSAADVLAANLPKEIAGLAWPKNMYWRTGKPERFVRPIRWMVALLDSDVVPLEFAGITAGNMSRGHRILAPGEVRITSAAQYAETLRAASVMVAPNDRRYTIERDSGRVIFGDGAVGSRPASGDEIGSAYRSGSGAAGNVPANGLRIRPDANLLSTTVNLTEFPSVLLGCFDREFLALPEEVLVTVMRDHQKYFAVETSDGRLAPHFLAVLNTAGDPAGLIGHGNERVLRARFNDARFFWQTDQKTPLTARVEMLKAVTFQKDLGSYYDKTERVVELCERLADGLSEGQRFSAAEKDRKKGSALAAEGRALDREALRQAATLCKADLTTELVKEFTELQGVVGGLYARAQGLGETVAQAIYHHYQPESMDDPVPPTLEGALLSLADKADTIAGMFSLGLIPSGSKDPFALRRQANGMVKIIAEYKLPLFAPIMLIEEAMTGFDGSEAAKRFVAKEQVLDSAQMFFRERMEFYLKEVLGYPYDVVNAVLAVESNVVVSAIQRAEAVSKVRGSDEFQAIAAAVKRMKNILRQAEEKGVFKVPEGDYFIGVSPAQCTEPAEQALAKRAAEIIHDQVKKAEAGQFEDYPTTLGRLAALRQPIDRFFDEVMVMVDDDKIRKARLALLFILNQQFLTIADFSEIVTESK